MKAELIIIQTPADYTAARALVSSLMDAAKPDDGARLRAQAIIIAAYEARVQPPPPVDPIEAIKFRMEQQGQTRRDLEEIIGTRTRIAEVLNRKLGLSIAMIRRLNERLGIPAEVLIRPSRKTAA